MADVTMEELPVGIEPTTVPESPVKDSNSVPSTGTDEESAYHDEEEGIEIDEVSTIIVVNDYAKSLLVEQEPTGIVQSKTEPVAEKKNSKKDKKSKRKSFRLFGRKVKKSARAAPKQTKEVPGLVLTKSEDDISFLTSSKIDEKSQNARVNELMPSLQPETAPAVSSPEKSSDEAICDANPVKNGPVQENKAEACTLSQLNEGKVVKPGESSGLTILAMGSNEEEETPEEEEKKKSLRLFSNKKGSKAKEQVAAPPVVITPPSCPPSTISVVKTQEVATTVKDDPIEDAAVGISRKWALFFHQEKGEKIDYASDDSSQGSGGDSLLRAVPASDLSAVDIDQMSGPPNIVDELSEGDALSEAPKEEPSTPEEKQETPAAVEASEEQVASVQEQATRSEAKEKSSHEEVSEEPSLEEAPEEPSAVVAPEEPVKAEAQQELAAATSPSNSKRKKWGMFSKQKKNGAEDCESDGDRNARAIPLSDLPPEDSSLIPNDDPTGTDDDSTAGNLTEGDIIITADDTYVEEGASKPQDAPSETTGSIFTPLTVAMAALTGSIIQDPEGVEVSASKEDKAIESETNSILKAPEDDSAITAETLTKEGKEPQDAPSETIGSIFAPLSEVAASLTGSIIQDTEGVEVPVQEEAEAAAESESEPMIDPNSLKEPDESSTITTDTCAEEVVEEPKDAPSETTDQSSSPWSLAMAALTGSISVQYAEGVEVSATDDKAIEFETESAEDVQLENEMVAEEEPDDTPVSPENLSSSKISEESSVFSGLDSPREIKEPNDDEETQDEPRLNAANETEDDVAPNGENSNELEEEAVERNIDDDVTIESIGEKPKDEQLEDQPSDSLGMFASTMAAFIGSVFVHDTGDVEVGTASETATAPVEQMDSTSCPTKEASTIAETEQVTAAPMEETSTEVQTDSVEIAEGSTAPDVAVYTEGDEDSVASGTRAGPPEKLSVSASNGVIAQRKAHLDALADTISARDAGGTPDSVSKKSSRGGFKTRLSTILSKHKAAKKESVQESDDVKCYHQLIRNSSLIDDDSELGRHFNNDFFKQFDEETIGDESTELEFDGRGLVFVNAACISDRMRCSPPPTLRFDDRQFDGSVELKLCGATAPTWEGFNRQHETESKLAAFIDNFDGFAACGRPSDAAQDNSVYPGSEAALSGNNSTIGGDEKHVKDPLKVLDKFFEEASLDESFWSALDDNTIQSASSGSIRKIRQLFYDTSSIQSSKKGYSQVALAYDDSDLDDSLFDTVEERDYEDNVVSEGHEVVAASKYAVPIDGSDSILDDDAPADETSKENVDPANGKPKESGNARNDAPSEVKDDLKSTKGDEEKSPDKAVDDIKKAMATLKKYASRHGVSEPELLWRIQEEHKKRKGWSASMAEF